MIIRELRWANLVYTEEMSLERCTPVCMENLKFHNSLNIFFLVETAPRSMHDLGGVNLKCTFREYIV